MEQTEPITRTECMMSTPRRLDWPNTPQLETWNEPRPITRKSYTLLMWKLRLLRHLDHGGMLKLQVAFSSLAIHCASIIDLGGKPDASRTATNKPDNP